MRAKDRIPLRAKLLLGSIPRVDNSPSSPDPSIQQLNELHSLINIHCIPVGIVLPIQCVECIVINPNHTEEVVDLVLYVRTIGEVIRTPLQPCSVARGTVLQVIRINVRSTLSRLVNNP